MKFMLLVYSDEKAWTPEEWTQCTQDSSKICHELHQRGQFKDASPLHPVGTAQSVRIRGDRRLVTAGPFAETTEQLGGYFLIDVPNVEAAIEVASRLPSAKKGTVEVRRIFELDHLPNS
jgi:hypothetical protein